MFLVFGGDRHYSIGGADDLIGSYSDIESAIKKCKKVTNCDHFEAENCDWSHVFDIEKEEITFKYGDSPIID